MFVVFNKEKIYSYLVSIRNCSNLICYGNSYYKSKWKNNRNNGRKLSKKLNFLPFLFVFFIY